MLRTSITALMLALALVAPACDDDDGNGSQTPETATGAATSAPQAGGSEPTASNSDSGDGEVLTTVEIADQMRGAIVRVTTETATVDPFGRVIPGTGVGTGFFIDDDGHIVTNNHVVSAPGGQGAAESISVTLADLTTLPATIVGRDPATDIAVLEVEGADVEPAEWGEPGELQVGQEVVAIGYALGLEGAPTVTQGVLSALNRTIEEPPFTIPEAIQTDASINPGNSGGPLVNTRGDVIGINTAIIQNAQNIGFAISMELARPIVEQLIAEGSIDRAFVGIAAVDVNERIARNLGLPVDDGVIIDAVAPGSPADEAGLERGDVIVEVDGVEIANNGELLQVLAQHEPGDTVSLTFIRDGEEQETEITLGERPAQ